MFERACRLNGQTQEPLALLTESSLNQLLTSMDRGSIRVLLTHELDIGVVLMHSTFVTVVDSRNYLIAKMLSNRG